MKMKCHSLLAAAATSLLLLLPARADDAVEIKQRWVAGKAYSFTQTMQQESELELAGNKMTQKLDSTTDFSVKVTSDSGKKKVTMRYDHMAMDMDMGPQKMKYDSAKPEDAGSPLGGTFGLLIGKEFRIVVDEKDQLQDIENWDDIASALKGAGPAAMGITKDSILQLMKQGMLQTYPGHPVKPGDQWQMDTTVDLPQMGKIAIIGTHTLKSVETHDGARSAQIVTDAKMSINPSDKPAAEGAPANPLAAMNVKLEDSSLSGTTWFDLDLGIARSADFNQSFTMTMNNPTDPSKSLRVPMKQVIRLKLNKVEDIK